MTRRVARRRGRPAACAVSGAGRHEPRGDDRQHRGRDRRRRPSPDRHRGRERRRGSPSPRPRRRKSIARLARPPMIAVRLRVEPARSFAGCRRRPSCSIARSSAPPHRSRSVRRCVAADGRGRGVRPLGDGRGGAARRADRPLAGAARRQAGVRRDRAARRCDRATGSPNPRWRTAASRLRPCSLSPVDEAAVERVRAASFAGEVGVSAWNGLAVARLCAKDGAALRRDLAAVLTALAATLPRLWLN